MRGGPGCRQQSWYRHWSFDKIVKRFYGRVKQRVQWVIRQQRFLRRVQQRLIGQQWIIWRGRQFVGQQFGLIEQRPDLRGLRSNQQ